MQLSGISTIGSMPNTATWHPCRLIKTLTLCLGGSEAILLKDTNFCLSVAVIYNQTTQNYRESSNVKREGKEKIIAKTLP